jgi:hypothetical protein
MATSVICWQMTQAVTFTKSKTVEYNLIMNVLTDIQIVSAAFAGIQVYLVRGENP